MNCTRGSIHDAFAQTGIALILSLIMLLVISMLTLTTFQLSQGSLLIAGNQQARDEMLASAESVLEEAVSTIRMVQSPDQVLLDPCDGQFNRRCIDINGDGTDDALVDLIPQPFCVIAKTIPNQALDLNEPDDVGCVLGAPQTLGVEGSVSGNSLCAESLWEVTAVAADLGTRAEATVTQGVTVRVSIDDIDRSCP